MEAFVAFVGILAVVLFVLTSNPDGATKGPLPRLKSRGLDVGRMSASDVVEIVRQRRLQE